MLTIKQQYQVSGVLAITAVSLIAYTTKSKTLSSCNKQKIEKVAGTIMTVAAVNSNITHFRSGYIIGKKIKQLINQRKEVKCSIV